MKMCQDHVAMVRAAGLHPLAWALAQHCQIRPEKTADGFMEVWVMVADERVTGRGRTYRDAVSHLTMQLTAWELRRCV